MEYARKYSFYDTVRNYQKKSYSTTKPIIMDKCQIISVGICNNQISHTPLRKLKLV
jgi:hypothetical protein